jgi:DNA uptake protein ComE-like DNA-binding protein
LKNFKSHFKFTKQERSGIFFLLLLIVLIQVTYFAFRSFAENNTFQSEFTSDAVTQAQIDDLKSSVIQKGSIKIYPFNPNFISDYKGYTLGMSVDEIDRLHTFREKNNYINSAKDFQKITQVSDSLLKAITPFFKFPKWTKKTTPKVNTNVSKSKPWIKKNNIIGDLNDVTARDLKTIYGIGEKLSARIVKFRDRLGGFLVDDQLYDVYGLESEVIERILQRYKVQNSPQIEKININTASVEMLTKLIYLQRNVSINIIRYRDSQGSIKSFEELSKIENFPTEKIDRIALYLSL